MLRCLRLGLGLCALDLPAVPWTSYLLGGQVQVWLSSARLKFARPAPAFFALPKIFLELLGAAFRKGRTAKGATRALRRVSIFETMKFGFITELRRKAMNFGMNLILCGLQAISHIDQNALTRSCGLSVFCPQKGVNRFRRPIFLLMCNRQRHSAKH